MVAGIFLVVAVFSEGWAVFLVVLVVSLEEVPAGTPIKVNGLLEIPAVTL